MNSQLVKVATALTLLVFAATANAQRSAGEHIDDVTLATSVKARLVDDDVVRASEINVETNAGNVALIGYVDTEEQKKRAISLAGKTDGAEHVIDAMVVQPGGRSLGQTVDDEALHAKVKLEIAGVGGKEAVDVVVEVRRGEVLLGGFVRDQDAKDEIGRKVKAVEGVSEVHNRLGIRK